MEYAVTFDNLNIYKEVSSVKYCSCLLCMLKDYEILLLRVLGSKHVACHAHTSGSPHDFGNV